MSNITRVARTRETSNLATNQLLDKFLAEKKTTKPIRWFSKKPEWLLSSFHQTRTL